MQDKYAGDIGDYGKFALLKEMERAELFLGVNWYKTKPLEFEKYNDGKYLIPEKYVPCDSQLFEKLYNISISKNRSIAALQNAKLLETNKYFDENIPTKYERNIWQARAVSYFLQCDIVFLDPDNGLSVKSVSPCSPKSKKYVYTDELSDYISKGISVIFYNHRQRVKPDAYFNSIFKRLNADPVICDRDIFSVTFPKCTIRDYFIIATNIAHSKKIKQVLERLLAGPFGEKGLCRLHDKDSFL